MALVAPVLKFWISSFKFEMKVSKLAPESKAFGGSGVVGGEAVDVI
jgi:hypothetical protein